MKLEEIKALCDAATPGPWLSQRDGAWLEIQARQPMEMDASPILARSEQVTLRYDPILKGKFHNPADAIFVAASRQIVPELLQRLEVVEAEFKRVLEELKRVKENCR